MDNVNSLFEIKVNLSIELVKIILKTGELQKLCYFDEVMTVIFTDYIMFIIWTDVIFILHM